MEGEGRDVLDRGAGEAYDVSVWFAWRRRGVLCPVDLADAMKRKNVVDPKTGRLRMKADEHAERTKLEWYLRFHSPYTG